METASQLAWRFVGGHDYSPPSGVFGQSHACWLCGGSTEGKGWKLREAIPATFTNHNLAKAQSSDAVCQGCIAMSSKATWDRYVANHPEMGLKTGKPISWRFYSHCFFDQKHFCPGRNDWRRLLVDPPSPPFIFVVSVSGQKHLIFRSKIAIDRRAYPVRMEDELFIVHTHEFESLLRDFQAAYDAGFSKDQILTGNYHQESVRKVGLDRWRNMERHIRPWRTRQTQWMRLAHFCLQRQKVEDD